MLTLTETVDAINAIDTDPGVIRNACKRVLYPDIDFNGPNRSELALMFQIHEICIEYTKAHLVDGKTSPEGMLVIVSALTKTLASQIAASTKPGHEESVIEISVIGLTRMLRFAFAALRMRDEASTGGKGISELADALVAMFKR